MIFFCSSDIFVNRDDNGSSSSSYKRIAGFLFKVVCHCFLAWQPADSLSVSPSSFHLLSAITIDSGSVSVTW